MTKIQLMSRFREKFSTRGTAVKGAMIQFKKTPEWLKKNHPDIYQYYIDILKNHNFNLLAK